MVGYIGNLGSALGLNSDQTQGALSGVGSLAGLGLTIAGTLGASKAASEEAAISGQEAQTEMQMNNVRRQMMQIDVNRRMIQSQRQTQDALHAGKAAAANQGALQSSGYKGGQAQVTAQGAYNLTNLNQDLQLGNQMFDLTNELDTEKFKMAQAQSKAATASGTASLGGAIASQAGNFAKLAMLF